MARTDGDIKDGDVQNHTLASEIPHTPSVVVMGAPW